MGRDGVARVYRRLFLKAELTRHNAGPHALRHAFGTNYIRAVGGVRQLQAILGHQRIDTTMIYVHLAGQHVEADHALHSKARVMGLLGRCVGLNAKRPTNPSKPSTIEPDTGIPLDVKPNFPTSTFLSKRQLRPNCPTLGWGFDNSPD